MESQDLDVIDMEQVIQNENQAANNLNNQAPQPIQETQNIPPSPHSKKWIFIFAGSLVLVIVLFSIFILALGKSAPKSSTIQPTQGPSPTVTIEMKKALDEAKQAAREYDNQLENLRTEYPWLRKLPIGNEKYFVYFDLEKKKFIGSLYPAPGEDAEQIKATAIKELRETKEIPVDNFQFEWTTNP